ncbi:MAG TPA: 50S ribosomal protein L20 [Deltaproteobacteria bacterium]|nr:50S ribosomal protein L20 [Deltaproteobacteria bacterium]HCP45210.1 50S ribosomal protein L20 [Deltaproteobacteria bacterium]|tara:strand:- start:711 stop:1058 length:348 start_codon:yes stop_codon:yes gene_type:complete
MPRVKRAVIRRKRINKLFKASKGFFGGRKNLIRTAVNAVQKARLYQYRDRRNRKRDFRRLWIARINAASRTHGLSYSRFMGGLKKQGVDVNRKMLAQIAIDDPQAFSDLVSMSRS